MTQEPKIFPYIARLLQGTEVVWKPLGEVAEIINGYAFQSGKYSDEGLRVIRISDVQKGKISDENLRYYPIEYINKLGRAVLFKNDLVMSLTGNVGRVAVLNESHLPAGLNQRVACIRPKNNIFLTRFLFHFFDQNSFAQEAMQNATGGGQKNMSTTWLSKLLIPLPPLSVQQEIVRILDKFTQLEAELEAELDCRKRQYEYYRNKLLTFNEIGGGTEIVWKTLGEVGTFIRGNGLQKKDLITSGVPAIHYGQIYTYYGISAEQTISFVSPETAEGLRKVDYGDVIITNTSENIDDVGKAVAYCVKEQGVTGGHATIFKPSEKIIGKYLVYYTQTTEFSNQKRKYAKGTKVIDISANDLTKITIPLPPLSEQQRIANILDKFDTLVNSISEGLPKEIALRRKQYEYYREKLLSFPS